MTFVEKALAAADKEANNTNRPTFKKGDKVVIYGIDFNGAKATVIGHSFNMLRLPLIRVKLHELNGQELSFYPSELQKLAE